jgi:DNA polymerase elongation subunit (family B)
MDIAFDIETIPNSGMIDRLPAIEVKAGNLKDPAKIAEKEAAAKAEQIDKMALSPLYGRVCAWVSQDDKVCNSLSYGCLHEDSDAEETRTIEAAFETLAGNRVITYNGNGFDLPFIYRRAVLLGIDTRQFGMPTLAEMTARYNNKHHVDLMQVWCGFGNFEKLDNIAGVMLDDHKIEIDFRDFPEMIKTAEGRNKLLQYCAQDVILTKRLWSRIAGILI